VVPVGEVVLPDEDFLPHREGVRLCVLVMRLLLSLLAEVAVMVGLFVQVLNSLPTLFMGSELAFLTGWRVLEPVEHLERRSSD